MQSALGYEGLPTLAQGKKGPVRWIRGQREGDEEEVEGRSAWILGREREATNLGIHRAQSRRRQRARGLVLSARLSHPKSSSRGLAQPCTHESTCRAATGPQRLEARVTPPVQTCGRDSVGWGADAELSNAHCVAMGWLCSERFARLRDRSKRLRGRFARLRGRCAGLCSHQTPGLPHSERRVRTVSRMLSPLPL